jgi:hypothetical protein
MNASTVSAGGGDRLFLSCRIPKSRKESVMAQHKKERTREIERRRRRREKRAKLRAKGLLPPVGASK